MPVETDDAERTPRGKGERLRERLIDAALAIVDEHEDAGQITIRAVTRQAGVSPTAFYLHFDKREDLLLQVVDRCFSQMRAAVAEGAVSGSTAADRLLGAGVAYIQFARGAPARYAMIFGPQSPLSADASDEDREQVPEGEAAFDDLQLLVAAALGKPEPDDRTRECAVGIWTGIHGFVTLQNCRPQIEWPGDEEFAAQLARAWLGDGPI